MNTQLNRPVRVISGMLHTKVDYYEHYDSVNNRYQPVIPEDREVTQEQANQMSQMAEILEAFQIPWWAIGEFEPIMSFADQDTLQEFVRDIDKLELEVRRAYRYYCYGDGTFGGNPAVRGVEDMKKLKARVMQIFDAAIESIEEVATHQHAWGANDYCCICGVDGRA